MHVLEGGGGRGAVNKVYCYVAGNFFITVRALIGFFEVTSHLTMKLFPAKISERATFQIYDVIGEQCIVTHEC